MSGGQSAIIEKESSKIIETVSFHFREVLRLKEGENEELLNSHREIIA